MPSASIPLTFGIIGCRHGHVLSLIRELLEVPGVRCAGIYDSDEASMRAVLDRFPAKVAKSPDELLGDPAVPLIGTAEINKLKGPLILRALEAGKHVIADKPLCTEISDLDAIEKTATGKKLRVGLMLTERFGGVNRRMQQLVAEGRIGHVANVTCLRPHRLNRPARPDWMFRDELYGGILVDLAVHDADIIRWVAGGVFLEVTAYQQNWGNPADRDFGDIGAFLGLLSTGATGFVRTDWFTPGASPVHGDTRFLVTGTKGTIEVRTAGDLWSGRKKRSAELLLVTDDEPPKKIEPLPPEKTLVRDFLESIVLDTVPHITDADAFEATRAALMARLSARLGRTVHRREVAGARPHVS